MKVTVTPLTDIQLVRRACASTAGKDSKITYNKILTAEHSPMRCLMYWIEMEDIPSFVSVHLVRHKIGVEHFVQSKRDDRGGSGKEDRMTPVKHSMLINAQALIHMARRRLCNKAHKETVKVMEAIKMAAPMYLRPYLVPECDYRGGICHELKFCGRAGVRSVWKGHDWKDKVVEDCCTTNVG